jgi:hypothetical protein
MEHISTEITFIDKKENVIKVIYKEYPRAEIIINDISVHKFESLPYTNTVNPTKTQAKELISFYKKLTKAIHTI